LTVPLPVPLTPEVIVIQAALLVAVHEQAAFEALTVTLPVPPLDMTLRLAGLIENAQPEACETVKLCP
jgi:hypothetical protein